MYHSVIIIAIWLDRALDVLSLIRPSISEEIFFINDLLSTLDGNLELVGTSSNKTIR